MKYSGGVGNCLIEGREDGREKQVSVKKPHHITLKYHWSEAL